MAYIPDIPDSPRQAHLVLELTYESLVCLQQQQQPQQQTQDLHDASSAQGVSSNTLLLPSSQAICDAILTLKNRGILVGIQGFLDRTFTSMRYQVELLVKVSGVDVRPQLAIMDRITHACYRASNDRGGLCILDLESIILERTLVDLLHPIWANLHSNSQKDNIGDHSETSRRISVLLQVEGLVASLLVRLHTFLSQNLASRLSSHLLSLVMMVLRVYDECLLPEHLTPWCHVDTTLLVTGLLALLEICKLLRGVVSIGKADEHLVSRLCEHGIIDRALQAIHASASHQNLATCRAFIMTMIEYSGIFHCRDPAAASVLPGDLVPSADVLPQLSSANPLFHLTKAGNSTDYSSLTRKEQQRWIIAFLYLKFLYNNQSDTPEDLGQVVIKFLNDEEDFDHFYGSSWIQLTWIFVRAIQASAPEVVANRSLARFKLLRGLRISIQEERGWFAKSLLLNHLDDILVLAWDGDCTEGATIRSFHEGLLLKLMLMWLEKASSAFTENPSTITVCQDIEQVSNFIMAHTGALKSLQIVFVDVCREMETNFGKMDHKRCQQLLHIICNVIRALAQIASEQPIHTTRAGQEFFNGIIIVTLKSLSKEAIPIDAERDLWELSQSVIPLRTERTVETASDWIIEALDPSSALEQLSVHMETLQTAGYQNTRPSLFPRIVACIQLLLIFVESKRDLAATFQAAWFPIPALWDSIQSLIDNCLDTDWLAEGRNLQRSTSSAMASFAINGIVLLNKIHTYLPCVNRISTENLVLMGIYCLDIHDFYKRHDSCTRHCPELAEVIIELVGRAIESLEENRSHDKEQVWKEVDAMLNLLLEVLCGLLVDMTSSLAAWRVLHQFRGIFEALSSLTPRLRTNTTGNTTIAPSVPSPPGPSSPSALMMAENGKTTAKSSLQQRWFQLKVRHPSYDAVTNCLPQRWKLMVNQEVRTRLDSGLSENTPYHASLRQAALDILALRALADQGFTGDHRTDQQ